MHTNVLERIRALEADIERSIDSIVQQELFASSITNERHRVLLDHFTLKQAELVRGTAEKLLDAYLDEDDIVQAQEAPSDTPDDIAAALKDFEAKIADIREYHHTYRDLPPVRNELAVPQPKLLDDVFAAHERYGACFDMDAHYSRYSAFMVHTKSIAENCESAATADGGDGSGAAVRAELAPLTASTVQALAPLWPGRLDIFGFTRALPQLLLHEIEAHRKVIGFALYKPFVAELLAYLEDFYRRLHPLKPSSLERLLTEVEGDAEEYWAALAAAKAEVVSVANVTTATTRDGVADVAEENDGNDAAGATGSSASSKARARIAVENKVSCGLAIPPSLRRHAKKFSLWPLTVVEEILQGTPPATASSAGKYPASMSEVKAVCIMEAKAAVLLQSLLFKTLETTDKTLLRDYSRTMEELENDREAAEQEFLDSLEEVRKNSASTMEGTVAHAAEYNLKLALEDSKGNRRGRPHNKANAAAAPTAPAPLPPVEEEEEQQQLIGENGEPIPRWLAQLHQLDKMFRCDVCGGTVYKGPKVFREHFGAERHAEGLRRLGVTQHLKSFEGITSIRQVVEMRDRLSGAGEGSFRKRLRENVDNEEIQDARGHVVTAKEYLRLQQRRR